MAPIRVLVVEDSLTVRMHLCETIESDPAFEVVGVLADGRFVLDCCRTLRPDVITLDMELPGMNGVEVTRRVMADCATPILVVSASFNRGRGLNTFDAVEAGAVDVLDKSRAGRDPLWSAELLARLRQVARIRVISRPHAELTARALPGGTPEKIAARGALGDPPPEGFGIVAVGGSVGGPAAVAFILASLPRSFPVSLAVVLHVAPGFGTMLVEWLGRLSVLPVTTATDGAPVPPAGRGATVFVARPERHLVVSEGRLRLTDAPEVHSCRPSVDVLFESIAAEYGRRGIGCLLTGMGRDGAAGLLAMRRAGARTIAQDEATSAVYGMPRAAIDRGAAELVRPLDEIASTIAELAGGRGRSGSVSS